MAAGKILMVGPYPPPEGGWSTAIREEREELEARGIACRVLNLGANRCVPSEDYLCVRGGFDLVAKLLRHGFAGYVFRLHMNGDSRKGIGIALLASFVGVLCLRRSILSFHAGVLQRYFPHRGNPLLGAMWCFVFNLPAIVVCDSPEVRDRIRRYRRDRRGLHNVSPFSYRRVNYTPVSLNRTVETFLSTHDPVLFSYFAYRPEYALDMLFEALRRLQARFRAIGLLAVDDRSHPDSAVAAGVKELLADERLGGAVLATGEVGRGEFLTLLSRADLYIRTPMTDGVCSSILESLHVKVPVVASDNGSRPSGVVTYDSRSVDDMTSTLIDAIENREKRGRSLGDPAVAAEDGVGRLADIIEVYVRRRSAEKAKQV